MSIFPAFIVHWSWFSVKLRFLVDYNFLNMSLSSSCWTFCCKPADKQILQTHLEGKEEQEDGGSEVTDSVEDNFFGVPTFLTVSGQLHLEVLSGSVNLFDSHS